MPPTGNMQMLSYLYQLAASFERKLGMRPNILYLNRAHFRQVREAFADPGDLNRILRTLDMELLIDPDAVHPRVGWLPGRDRKAG